MKLLYFLIISIIICTINNLLTVVKSLPLGLLVDGEIHIADVCGDLSLNSNQIFKSLRIGANSTNTNTTNTSGSTTGTSSQLSASTTSSNTNSTINKNINISVNSSTLITCNYYISKNTVVNSLETIVGDTANKVINVLNVQHLLKFNGSLSLSSGSSIVIGCYNNNECLSSNKLDILGTLNIANEYSSLSIQSDLNIQKNGILKTMKSSNSSSSIASIINTSSFNNNGGLFDVDLPISIVSNLFNINSKGTVNINSPLTLNSGIALLSGNSIINLNNKMESTFGLNVSDESILKMNGINSNFTSTLLNLLDIGSKLEASESSLVSVSTFNSNGQIKLDNSLIQSNTNFNIGKDSIMNIVNEGGFSSNGKTRIDGRINVETGGYIRTGFGDLYFGDESTVKVNQGSIDIRSNIYSSGNSLFENDNSIFQFMGSSIEMIDQSIFKLGNCKQVFMESSLTKLSDKSQFQVLQFTNINTNNPFLLLNNSVLLIDLQSTHNQNNNDINLNDYSQMLISSMSNFTSEFGNLNLKNSSNMQISNGSFVNLLKGSTMTLFDNSLLEMNKKSSLNFGGGSNLVVGEQSEIRLSNSSSLNIVDSNSAISGKLSLSNDSTVNNNGIGKLDVIGVIQLSSSNFINNNQFESNGIFELIGNSFIENNGDFILSTLSSFKSDNGNHVLLNNKEWSFDSLPVEMKVKQFNNNGNLNIINSTLSFIQFNSTLNASISLINGSTVSMDNNSSLIHNGVLAGNGVFNTNIESSITSSIGKIDSISNLTINGTLYQKLESEFNIYVIGVETGGKDFTFINILNEFNPNIDYGNDEKDEKQTTRSLLSINDGSSNSGSNSHSSASSTSTTPSSLSGGNKTINIYLNTSEPTPGNITFIKFANQSKSTTNQVYNIKINSYNPKTGTYKYIDDRCKYQLQQTRTSLSLLISPTQTCEIITDSSGDKIIVVVDESGNTSITTSIDLKKKIIIAVCVCAVCVSVVVGLIIWKKRKINNFIKIKKESFFNRSSNKKNEKNDSK